MHLCPLSPWSRISVVPGLVACVVRQNLTGLSFLGRHPLPIEHGPCFFFFCQGLFSSGYLCSSREPCRNSVSRVNHLEGCSELENLTDDKTRPSLSVWVCVFVVRVETLVTLMSPPNLSGWKLSSAWEKNRANPTGEMMDNSASTKGLLFWLPFLA